MLLRDARPGVADLDAQIVAVGQRTCRNRVQVFVAHRDVHHAALGHGLHGVDHKILNDLTDLALVHLGCPEININGEVTAHLRSVQGKIGRLSHHLRQPDRRTHRLAATGERKQLLREIAGAQHPALRILQPAARRRHHLRIEHRQCEVAHHDGEQVVEIMRDAAREDTHRLKLRSAQDLAFQPGSLRDIAQHEHRADRPAVHVMDGSATPLDKTRHALPVHQHRAGRQLDDAMPRKRRHRERRHRRI